MDDNLLYCFLINCITFGLNFVIWRRLCGVEHILNIQIALIAFFSVFLICILLKLILNQINFSNDTRILDRYIQDYKFNLGCITFGSLFPFLAISMFEIDSTTSSLFFSMYSMFPFVSLTVIISPSLQHCDLDSTRLNLVAFDMNTFSVASVLFTLMLICFGAPNLGSNKLIYVLQQVAWVLGNLPYYIEFYFVMTDPLNVRLVRNEDEVVMNNNRGTNPDDFDSSDEPDDEQLPNYPAKVLIDSEHLQCNICFLPYSDRRVPLMLTKCGHSLCRKCCKAAQQQILFSSFINCPFCRTQTPGPVATLPKNYAIMRIVQKIGRVE